MITVGGGVFLLCVAVCAVIVSDRPWVKILCALYLAYFAISVFVEILRGRWEPALLIVPVLLVLLGVYVHGVHHMFDPKDRGEG